VTINNILTENLGRQRFEVGVVIESRLMVVHWYLKSVSFFLELTY